MSRLPNRPRAAILLVSAVFCAGAFSGSPVSEAHGYGHHHHVGIGYYGGWWGGAPWYPWPAWGWGWPYPSGPVVYPGEPPDTAWVDTDVSPGRARVFLDGEEIGKAGSFDGFPDYLAISPGEHRIEFRHPGYRTLRVLLDAERGGFYRIDRQLGRASETAAAEEIPATRAAIPKAAEGESGPPAETDRGPEPPSDGAPGPGLLRLRVEPLDAAVYLDGTFLGTGQDLKDGPGVTISPGFHDIEAVRPGWKIWKSRIEMLAGEERTLRIRLDPEPRGSPP